MTIYHDTRGTVSESLNLITDNQMFFIKRLVEERKMTEQQRTNVEKIIQGEPTSCLFASDVIDWMLSLPKREQQKKPVEHVEIEDGMYFFDADIYKVQHAVHGSGRQYAKKLIPGEHFGEKATFEYAPGVVRKLRPEHKLTQDQAQKFGALYGTCCRCGRTLTAEDSIERMMGPVCFGKMGW